MIRSASPRSRSPLLVGVRRDDRGVQVQHRDAGQLPPVDLDPGKAARAQVELLVDVDTGPGPRGGDLRQLDRADRLQVSRFKVICPGKYTVTWAGDRTPQRRGRLIDSRLSRVGGRSPEWSRSGHRVSDARRALLTAVADPHHQQSGGPGPPTTVDT